MFYLIYFKLFFLNLNVGLGTNMFEIKPWEHQNLEVNIFELTPSNPLDPF